ncbi:tetratricopeptide repeat protein, partial [Umezawaea endophytica]
APRNAHRFPDGQVFLDLRGFSPTDERLPPQVALLSLLSALGVAPGDVPSQPDAQIGLYRSLVADRGLLLVLDNAGDVGQVTPLLPGGSSAAVLITSRDNLNGLAATHGATSVTVPSLSRAESRELIATRLGPERLAAEPAAVDALTSLLGGLPLALSILATRAREHARFSLESLVCELRDETARLAALDVGGAVSVRAVFSWSSAALPPDLVRVFGLLGLAPQADLSLAAAASLVGLGTGEARAALSALERASLVEEHQPGRYRMHDLVKLYAFERAADLPVAERDAALPRLTDFYLHSACAAQKPLDPTDPTRPWITIDPPEPGCVPLGFTTPKEALDWFRAEAACLVTAQHEAVARGWHGVVWRLAWAQTAYYQQVGHPHLLHELWTVGLASARALGDGEVLLLALRRLGNASRRIGGFADAVELLEESVALATVVGSPFDQVLCLLTFAECLQTVGDSQGALDQCDRAEAINRTLDDPSLTLRVLASVAWYAAGCEQYERAEEAARTAVTLVVPGDFHAMTAILDTLGHIACRTGRLDQAADHYDEALAIAVENDDEYSIGDTAENVGWVYAMRDDLDRTTSRWNQAVHSYVVQQRAADAARVLGLLERLRQAESPAALVAERDTAAHP